MILDYNGILSKAQAETTVTDHISDNVIDLGAAGKRIIDPLWYVFRIDAAIVSAGGGTLEIKIVTSAALNLGTPTVLWTSGLLANATIVAWPANSIPYVIPVYHRGTLLRYLGAIYTIGSAVFTAGAWDLLPAINVPHPQL